jgi:holo-[acyl-carrier protein] synthase
MLGVGIDVIELSRMRQTIERSGEVFLRRVFSQAEMQMAHDHPQPAAFFASAFAAKEAVFKALALDWNSGVDLRDIEVGRGCLGEPVIRLRGPVEAAARAKGCGRVLLSLSYETDLAVAMAFAESEVAAEPPAPTPPTPIATSA